MIDYTKQLKQAINDSGVKFQSEQDKDILVEKIDQLLDRTVPNSIFNDIAIRVLQDAETHLRVLKDAMITRYRG